MENVNNIADFKKRVKIYKTHKLKNDFISINYAYFLGNNCISAPSKVKIEKVGTPYNSLAYYLQLRF
jgi:hypothetical protein